MFRTVMIFASSSYAEKSRLRGKQPEGCYKWMTYAEMPTHRDLTWYCCCAATRVVVIHRPWKGSRNSSRSLCP